MFAGNRYVYKVDTAVTLPALDDVLTSWTAWDGEAEIVAETGKEIAIVEVNSLNMVKAAGKDTVASA
jgi:hypothetical protein